MGRLKLLVVGLLMVGCAEEKPKPVPQQPVVIVIPAIPVPPVQPTPWPQVFFPSPATTQTQVNVWVYDPMQRKMVRRPVGPYVLQTPTP